MWICWIRIRNTDKQTVFSNRKKKVKKVASLLDPVEDNSSLVRDYHTHDQMMEIIDKLAADHPNLLKRCITYKILKVQKREILLFRKCVICHCKGRGYMFSILFFLKLAGKSNASLNLRCLSKHGVTWLTLSQHGVRQATSCGIY